MAAPVTDDDIALVGLLAVLQRKKKSDRTKWCKSWLRDRNVVSSHTGLLKELTVEPTDFRNYLRMTEKVYNKLLALVTPLIKKQDTVMRAAISPHERLSATLRFLATGRAYQCMKFSTRISPQALSSIIPETCDANYRVLRKDHLQFPNSEDMWKEIARSFEQRWDFPHCIGAMDGKHIDIVPPAEAGSYYFNYKGRHSMVLLAIVDANYRIILVDFGTKGRVSDGGVLQNTTFSEKLKNNQLHIPSPCPVSESFESVPYVIVADDAFPLTTCIMKPFRQAQLNSANKEVFNYRLSRARHVVEKFFGILSSRFRVFRTRINLEPQNITKVVMAACILHNFLIDHQPTSYAPTSALYQEDLGRGTIAMGCDISQSNMMDLQAQAPTNFSSAPRAVREMFMEYFMTDGSVPWQDKHILRNEH